MKLTITNCAWQQHEEIAKIFELLGGNARLVGGCVRDYILFEKLVYDIDIATPLLPEVCMEKLSIAFKVIPTGLKHGTITIVGKNKYEITTLRKDEKTDGRHAEVAFDASWQEDSARRDFTMNALYADLQGNVFDYHNGLQDLSQKMVKFIGDCELRIKEDYLRIMRFFRFASRFGNWSEESLQACLDLKNGLHGISKERITQEWFKIIEGPFLEKIFDALAQVLQELGFNLSRAEFALKNRVKLSALGFTSLINGPALCFSNAEKKYIRNLQKTKLENETDAIMLSRAHGADFLSDKMIIEQKFFQVPELGAFPLMGQDVINLGYKGKEIGTALQTAYKIWVEKRGEISKQELIERIQ